MAKAFRETIWFKKGELDAQAAQQASDDDLDPRAADLLPVEDRYLDDGSVSASDSLQYSVRTGETRGMPRLERPTAEVAFDAGTMVGELKRGRIKVIAMIGASLAFACAMALIYVG
jgi:hypothetical protein